MKGVEGIDATVLREKKRHTATLTATQTEMHKKRKEAKKRTVS